MSLSQNVQAASPIQRLHPVLWGAAVSVILFSVVGIAKLAGFFPEKKPEVKEAAVLTIAVSEPKPLTTAETNQPSLPTAQESKSRSDVHSANASPKIAKRSAPTIPHFEFPAAIPPPLNSGIPPDYVAPPTAPPVAAICLNCGVIESITELSREQPGSGAGAVLGTIAGGVLGSNVGKGSGRALATVAGIFGGAIVGDSVERSQHRSISYKVLVRMDNGGFRMVETDDASSLLVGDHIRLSGGRLSPL